MRGVRGAETTAKEGGVNISWQEGRGVKKKINVEPTKEKWKNRC